MAAADESIVEALAEGAPVTGLALAPPMPRPYAPNLPWSSRLLNALTTYLPVLLMAVLALGTWWLVKNTPTQDNDRVLAPLRHEPDYTMTDFLVQRYAPDGSLRVQLEGDTLRHYPDTDTVEIDKPRIRSTGRDGRVTTATAQHALSNGDGSEVQLSGGAYVVREAYAGEQAIEFRGEFLHAFLATERVRSHLPVVVTQGDTEVRAGGMEYDNLAHTLDFKGRVRAVFLPARRSTP